MEWRRVVNLNAEDECALGVDFWICENCDCPETHEVIDRTSEDRYGDKECYLCGATEDDEGDSDEDW